MDERIRNLRRALLICHAPLDNRVGIENATHLYTTARHPKSFLSLDRADHLLSKGEDSHYAGAVIAAWATRYLSEGVSAPTEPPPTQGDTIVRTGKVGFRTDVQVDHHQLIADEPVEIGGTDLGPSPYDYLNAALGSCTAITLRMYADRKGWPLDEIEIRLRHTKIHAEDCEQCETETGKIDRIEREIALKGDLDAAQRQRLLEIADRCPVHRTLHGETDVQTTLVEP
jgi:putative redox protein